MKLPQKNKTAQKGFTLIELLVVITIIAILAVGVFVALDPATRFADARDSHRWNDVNSILTAIHEYIVDTDGAIPPGIDATQKHLGTCASGAAVDCSGAATSCLNLSTELAPYLLSIPVDPSETTAGETGYSVVATGGIITVRACEAENSSISISR